MKKPNEKGVSAVEFALILPVLVLILFGIIEFGLILYNQQVITNASREGAREGILFNSGERPDVTAIKTVVAGYANEHLITFKVGAAEVANVDVSNNGIADTACAALGDDLKVVVNYQYTYLVLSPIMGLFGGSEGPTFSLAASTTMRCE
jgi:Flp pilus assembly protein TadG